MMKGDPEDLKNLTEDFRGLIQRHTDAIRANPDLAGETVRLRDKWIKRYESITDRRKEPTPKTDDGFVQ